MTRPRLFRAHRPRPGSLASYESMLDDVDAYTILRRLDAGLDAT